MTSGSSFRERWRELNCILRDRLLRMFFTLQMIVGSGCFFCINKFLIDGVKKCFKINLELILGAQSMFEGRAEGETAFDPEVGSVDHRLPQR